MPNNLFWLVHSNDNDIIVFIQPAGDIVTARMKAMLAGLLGEFTEGHQLDDEMAKKVPKQMVGRALSRKDATALLKKMA